MATDSRAVNSPKPSPKTTTRYTIVVDDGGVPADLVDRVSRLHAAAFMAKSCDSGRRELTEAHRKQELERRIGPRAERLPKGPVRG